MKSTDSTSIVFNQTVSPVCLQFICVFFYCAFSCTLFSFFVSDYFGEE